LAAKLQKNLKQGNSPGCSKNIENFQVCYIAINKAGETGCFSLQEGFSMMEYRDGENQRTESDYHLKN